jgi:MFS family permease
MDRVMIAAAVPVIQKEFGFTLVTVGWILSAFRWGYALFQIPGGWLGDRIGPRRALSLIVTWWSLFTSATALAWSAASMIVCRFLFGVGEAGAFPIATRSLSRWMLPAERGFAQGVTHAGSRLGAALTPALVVLLMARWGWRAPFFAFGALGLLWVAVWYGYYRDTPEEHRGVNPAELGLIQAATGGPRRRPPPGVPWRKILSSANLWTLCLMYFCYAYCISVYLVWFPKYLHDHRGFDLTRMGLYAGLPLLAGVLLTAADTLLMLWLTRFGIRIIEAFVLSLITVIGACFLVEIWLAKPALGLLAGGLVPRLNSQSLYVAIGILGAMGAVVAVEEYLFIGELSLDGAVRQACCLNGMLRGGCECAESG